MNIIDKLINKYGPKFAFKSFTNPATMILIKTDDKYEQTDRYNDYYILLQILFYNNKLDKLDEIEKNLSEQELIYWYGSDEEADKRAYQLKHFKEIHNVK